MAINTNGSGNLTRSFTSAFGWSFACWVRFTTTPSSNATFFALDNNVNRAIQVVWDTIAGNVVSFSSGTGNAFTIFNPGNAWAYYSGAVTSDGAGGVSHVCRRIADATFTTVTADGIGTGNVPAALWVGKFSGGEQSNCHFDGVRIWNRILTTDELKAEYRTLAPAKKRRISIYSYVDVRSVAAVGKDRSGLGNNWTVGGTFVAGVRSPVPEYPAPLLLRVAAPAPAGTTAAGFDSFVTPRIFSVPRQFSGGDPLAGIAAAAPIASWGIDSAPTQPPVVETNWRADVNGDILAALPLAVDWGQEPASPLPTLSQRTSRPAPSPHTNGDILAALPLAVRWGVEPHAPLPSLSQRTSRPIPPVGVNGEMPAAVPLAVDWGEEPHAPLPTLAQRTGRPAPPTGANGDILAALPLAVDWGMEPPGPPPKPPRADFRPLQGEPLPPPPLPVTWGWEPGQSPAAKRPNQTFVAPYADGMRGPVVLVVAPWGYEPPGPQTSSPRADSRWTSGQTPPPTMLGITWGWEPAWPRPPTVRPDLRGIAGEPLGVVVFVPTPPWGYEPAGPVTRSPRAENRAAYGDVIPPTMLGVRWGWEPPSLALRPAPPIPRGFSSADWSRTLAIVTLPSWGYEPPYPVTRSPKADARTATGMALPTVALVQLPAWGWEAQSPLSRQRARQQGAATDPNPFLQLTPWGWEWLQSPIVRRRSGQQGATTDPAPVLLAPWAGDAQSFVGGYRRLFVVSSDSVVPVSSLADWVWEQSPLGRRTPQRPFDATSSDPRTQLGLTAWGYEPTAPRIATPHPDRRLAGGEPLPAPFIPVLVHWAPDGSPIPFRSRPYPAWLDVFAPGRLVVFSLSPERTAHTFGEVRIARTPGENRFLIVLPTKRST